jgi:hypothetical protein
MKDDCKLTARRIGPSLASPPNAAFAADAPINAGITLSKWRTFVKNK